MPIPDSTRKDKTKIDLGKKRGRGHSAADTVQPPQPGTSLTKLRKEIQEQLADFPQRNQKGHGEENPKRHNVVKDRAPNGVEPKKDRNNRGVKRDRSGNVLPGKVNALLTNGKTKDGEPTEDDESGVLEKEVRALGGTTEDLDLIADVNSDSEVEGFVESADKKKGQTDKTNGLNKGITNILKEIALAQGVNTDSAAESDSDFIEEDELVASHTESTKPKLAAAAEKPNKQILRKGGARLLVEPRPDWFNVPMPKANAMEPSKQTASQQTLSAIKLYASSLLEKENQAFKASQQSSSSQAFYETVISSGTLSDKISALTLAVQESPLHNVHALESLINLASKRARSQALDSLRALKDLFAQGSLLPTQRKLTYFSAQPDLLASLSRSKAWMAGDKLPGTLTDVQLVIWIYEDWLKGQYFEVLKMLETWCSDEIDFAKSRAISYVFELLKERPEQEANLLRLLINKLGDPVKKIASQTSYLLMQLLATHPAMKMTVISAIETDFMFRPGQSLHGKYYAVITLNQTVLSSREEDIALKLLGIYFGLFVPLLKPSHDVKETQSNDKKERTASKDNAQKSSASNPESEQIQGDELREKLISAILTGVNRAHPYTGSENQGFMNHLDTLFKVVHSSNFNTSIQALLLIQQLSLANPASNDRFYRILYESLLDPRLILASKHQLYLNLLHRALKADLNPKRVKAFVKRLLQILGLHEPSFVCGVFFLLQDLEKTFPSLAALVDHAEDHDDDEEVFRDVDEDRNEQTSTAIGDKSVASGPSDDGHYDAHKRAPEHAGAENSCAWELLPYLAHYHPSVSVSADQLLRHAKLPGKPDLNLHSLIHFLDRFVYRNAKVKNAGLKGSSIMQPMASDDTHAVLINATAGDQKVLPVNSEEFLAKSSADIAAQDVFFHKYFTTLGADSGKKTTKQKKKARVDNDAESGDEDEVWKAMIDSAPDLEGEEDSDGDIGFSDLESDMEEDSAPGEDDDGSVDIGAGIFDDTDEEMMDQGVELDAETGDQEDESETGLEDSMTDGKPVVASQKSGKKQHTSRDQRKKLRGLPTFASAADYAKMLEDEVDEDLG